MNSRICGQNKIIRQRETGAIMKHHLMLTFYVCILWLTRIIRITYNDFHHKAGRRFGTFEASHDGNSTIATASILCLSEKQSSGL